MDGFDAAELLSAGPTIVGLGVELANSMLSSGFAHKVFGAFAALAAAIAGVKILLEIIEGEGAGEALAELVELILVVGIFLFMLQNYAWIFADSIKALFAGLAGAMGLGSGTEDVFGGIKALFKPIQNAFGVIFSPDDSWYSAIIKFVSNFLTVVVLLTALVALIGASIAYVAVYLMGDALAGVALAVGPFFVSLGVWEVTRGWFRNWLEFLVVAFMYKVVAGVLVLLLAKAFNAQMASLASGAIYATGGAGVEAAVSIGFAVKAVILASVILYLLLTAPSIAHGLAKGGMSMAESFVKGIIPGMSQSGKSAGGHAK